MDRFAHEAGHRIVISTAGHTFELAKELIGLFEPPLNVAYSLTESDDPNYPVGQYWSKQRWEVSQVLELMSETEFWNSDGFHELYVEGQSGLHKELIVVDSHQLLFVYGHLQVTEELLLEKGFKRESPLPLETHVHIAAPTSKPARLRFLNSREWEFEAAPRKRRRIALNPLRLYELLKYLLASIRHSKKD